MEDTFFFDQKCRKFSRRPRKHSDDVRSGLFKPKPQEVHRKSFQVGNIQMDSFDDDLARYLFDELRMQAPNILNQLGRFIYRYDNIDQVISNGLRHHLSVGWHELTDNAIVVTREWQTVAMKENHLMRMSERADTEDEFITLLSSGHDSRESFISERSVLEPGHRRRSSRLSSGTPSKMNLLRSKYADTLAVTHNPSSTSRANLSSKVNLPEIYEESEKMKKRDRSASIMGRSPSRMSRRGTLTQASYIKPYGRQLLSETRYKLGDSKHSLSFLESVGSHTVAMTEAKSFYSVISFIYSSKQTEERGWLVKKDSEVQMEIRPTIEWCLTLLRVAIRTSTLYRHIQIEQMRTTCPLMQYVTPQSLGGRKPRQPKPFKLRNGLFPVIPPVEHDEPTETLLRSVVSDGTSVIHYQSGRRAIVKCHAGATRVGYYVLAYSDTPDSRLLAVFIPTGNGVLYHPNGNISFCSNEFGAHVAENNGSITRKWRWNTDSRKLDSPILIQVSTTVILLTSCMSFRCYGRDAMFLLYQNGQDVLRVSITHEAKVVEAAEANDTLMSSYSFTSKWAKDLVKKQVMYLAQGKLKTKKKKTCSMPLAPTSSIQEVMAPKERLKPHIAEARLIFAEETSNNERGPERELSRLQTRIKGLVDDWLEHYRLAIGIRSDLMTGVSEGAKAGRKRKACSAKSLNENILKMMSNTEEIIETEDKHRVKQRNLSAPSAYGRMEQQFTATSASCAERVLVPRLSQLSHKSRSRAARFNAHLPLIRQEKKTNIVCTVSLRTMMLGHGRQPCRCSHHFLSCITDVEYTRFITTEALPFQLIIVFVTSSLFPTSHLETEMMLSKIHMTQNRHRVQGCEGSRGDSFRILRYDVATAVGGSNHTQPLLLTQHNVVPGMYLMYQNGKLLFCDHIFNGMGNTRQDIRKQISKCRHDSANGKILPADFKFSPIKGRTGMRSAFGGEIGGAGVDHHGGVGTSASSYHLVISRSSSTNLTERALETKLTPMRSTGLNAQRIFEVCLSPETYFKESPRPTVVAS